IHRLNGVENIFRAFFRLFRDILATFRELNRAIVDHLRDAFAGRRFVEKVAAETDFPAANACCTDVKLGLGDFRRRAYLAGERIVNAASQAKVGGLGSYVTKTKSAVS